MLEWFFHFYAASAAPRLEALPHSLIHGDANDENVLVQEGRISGLLDFGDCLENPTVCELAITLAYAMLDRLEDRCWAAVGDARALPFRNASFDAIIHCDVLC